MCLGSSHHTRARSVVVDSQLTLSLRSVAEAAPAATGYPLAVLRYFADARERRGDRAGLWNSLPSRLNSGGISVWIVNCAD